MKWLIPVLFALCGCFKDPTPIVEDNRSPKAKEFNVQFLFEHEGCRLYRFSDDSMHYYASCSCSSTTSKEVCTSNGEGGQNCSLEVINIGRKER
jgi:hypothetical protein